jgi:hypothetical protein
MFDSTEIKHLFTVISYYASAIPAHLKARFEAMSDAEAVAYLRATEGEIASHGRRECSPCRCDNVCVGEPYSLSLVSEGGGLELRRRGSDGARVQRIGMRELGRRIDLRTLCAAAWRKSEARAGRDHVGDWILASYWMPRSAA